MSSTAGPVSSVSPILAFPRLRNRAAWVTPTCMLMSDLFALLLVAGFTMAGRSLLASGFRLQSYIELLPFLAMVIPAFLLQGLYPGNLIHPAEEMRRIFYSLSVVFLIWASITFLWRTGEFYSRSVFLITWVAGSPTVLLTRYLTRCLFGTKPWWGVPAVVLGSGPTAQRVVRKLQNGMLGVKVAGFFSEEEVLSWAHDMPPFWGDLESAARVAGARVAHYAIVALPHKSNLELSKAIQDYCHGLVMFCLSLTCPGVCSLGITARDIGGDLGLELPQRLFHRSAAVMKRLLDFMASFAILIALAPVFLLAAIAIRMTSKGPVFYGQSRFGRGGRVFTALKFHTMTSEADRVLAEYLIANPEQLLEWSRDHKLKNDPRVTRVGRWLRRYSLAARV
jgi:hypothetical protein